MALRHTIPIVSALIVFSLLAAAQIAPPQAGIIRTSNGQVRQILGIGENYVAGSVVWPEATAVAFSQSLGLVANGQTLALIDAKTRQVLASLPVTDEHPVLAVDNNPQTAVAYLPSRSALEFVKDNQFASVDIALPTGFHLAAVHLAAGIAQLVGQSDLGWEAITYSLETGNSIGQKSLSSVAGTVYQWQGCDVFSDGVRLSLSCSEIPDPISLATLASIGSPVSLRFECAAGSALHISSATGRRHWLVVKARGRVSVSELPFIPQVAP